ncbi:unnamed protein product, partial [Staurois parvus]
CTVSAVSGHLLYCLQSLVISCTVCSLWSSPVLSAVSGHLLYCLQSLVISCTVCSLWSSPVLPFLPLKPRCVLWSGASYGAKNTVL